jgi:hypothetical protein
MVHRTNPTPTPTAALRKRNRIGGLVETFEMRLTDQPQFRPILGSELTNISTNPGSGWDRKPKY